jgi:purine-binding chemotaxis protein CheW
MRKFIVFRLGSEEFGIDVDKAVEILRARKSKPVPDMPDFISGVITIRGEMIPIVDMRTRFSINPEPGKERNIIVRSGKEKVGLLVDDVQEIADFNDSEVMKPPIIFKGLKNKYLEGLGKRSSDDQQERVIMLLNMENILSDEERIQLRKSKGQIGAGKKKRKTAKRKSKKMKNERN